MFRCLQRSVSLTSTVIVRRFSSSAVRCAVKYKPFDAATHKPSWSLEAYEQPTVDGAARAELTDAEVRHIASLSALEFSDAASGDKPSDLNQIRSDLSSVIRWIDQIKSYPIPADTQPLFSPLDSFPTPKPVVPLMPAPPANATTSAATTASTSAATDSATTTTTAAAAAPVVPASRSGDGKSGIGIRVRPDAVSDAEYSEALLSNAANHELSFFVVRKVVDKTDAAD